MKQFVIKISLLNPIHVDSVKQLLLVKASKLHRLNVFTNFKQKVLLFNFKTNISIFELKDLLLSNIEVLNNNDCDIFDYSLFNKEILTHENHFESHNEYLNPNKKNYVDFLNLDYSEEEMVYRNLAIFGKFMFEKNMSESDKTKREEFSKSCKSAINILDFAITKQGIDKNKNFLQKLKSVFINTDKKTKSQIFIHIADNQTNKLSSEVDLNLVLDLDEILEKISDKGFKSLTDKEINFLNNYTDTI